MANLAQQRNALSTLKQNLDRFYAVHPVPTAMIMSALRRANEALQSFDDDDIAGALNQLVEATSGKFNDVANVKTAIQAAQAVMR